MSDGCEIRDLIINIEWEIEAVGPGGASAGGGALVPGARPGARAGATAGPPATQEIKVKVVCETCNTALVNKVIKGKTDVVAARNAGVGV